MKLDIRKNPRATTMFGLYNYGNLWSVYPLRKIAIHEAETIVGKPWKEACKFLEIHKVRVETFRP